MASAATLLSICEVAGLKTLVAELSPQGSPRVHGAHKYREACLLRQKTRPNLPTSLPFLLSLRPALARHSSLPVSLSFLQIYHQRWYIYYRRTVCHVRTLYARRGGGNCRD